MKQLYTLSILLCFSALAFGQGSISAVGTAGAVPINFDGSTAGILNGLFDASQISATPAVGDLNMNGVYIRDNISGAAEDPLVAFGPGGTNATNAAMQGTSTGGVSTSGIYAFNTGGSVALGFQGSGSRWGDGTGDDGHIIFRFQNNSGVALSNFTVGFTVYDLNDQGRTTTIEAFLTDDVATPAFGSALYSYTTTEVAAPVPAWTNVGSPTFSHNITIANGGYIYLRFLVQDGPSGSGSRDELALDDIFIYGDVNPAPVEMSPLQATTVEEHVRLNWTTYAEVNNAGFEIQRGTDAVHFKTIGFVKGQLQSNLNIDYSFVDETASNGINYYRIKQVDIDEKYHFSGIAKADVRKGGSFEASVYPNPIINNELNIDLESTIDDAAKVEVYNLNGQLISSTNWSLIRGVNRLPLELKNLSSGNYILSIRGTNINQQQLVFVAE